MATVRDQPFCIDVPMSWHLVRWNISTQARVHTFYLHSTVITSVQRYVDEASHTHLTATCGYDGTLKIWDTSDSDEYRLLCAALVSTRGPVARVWCFESVN